MRVFFYLTGVAAVILGAVIAACTGLFIYSAVQVNKEGAAYADAAIVAITSKWDADALLTRASPELIRMAGATRVRNLFDRMDALGDLTTVQDCKSAATRVSFDTHKTPIVNAAYNCVARYKNDTAMINIVLIKSNGAWKILGFHVNSPIFDAPRVRKA